MRVFRGFQHPDLAPACALTIGSFDGVHRGHQAMLALLAGEARQRGLPATVLTFEPHPRDYFARLAASRDFFAARTGQTAPARIATLRDKLCALADCGIAQTVVLRFDERLARLSPDDFIRQVLLDGLHTRYLLVGDDFRFGAKRAGDYALLDAAGGRLGFDVARMQSYEVHGLRVSSSAVRDALARGEMDAAAALLGRPYAVSGHVVHGAKLGRGLGYPTINLRVPFARPAAMGIFVARVHGLAGQALPGVASLGLRPTVDESGRVLLEVHCLAWPAALGAEGGYGKLVRVELLHKLRDEARYDGLDALTAAIRRDADAARAWFAASHDAERRQTTRDRI